MPGYVLHLYVGNELARKCSINKDLFIAGNLAPDAVHARIPYDRKHKKISHLKNGFYDRQLTVKENQVIFENSIDGFIENIQTMECVEERDFYSGYIAHVLTDYFFIRNLLDEIYRRCASLKYNSNEKSVTGRDFSEEYSAMDGVVIGIFTELHDVLSGIEKCKAFDVGDYVNEREILISRKWTINQIRSDKDFSKKLQYLNKNDFLSAIDNSIEFVFEYLNRTGLLEKVG